MIEIGEFSASVHIRDGEELFSSRQREYIREQALAAVQDFLDYRERVLAERRITTGVRDEQEGEA